MGEHLPRSEEHTSELQSHTDIALLVIVKFFLADLVHSQIDLNLVALISQIEKA